jgi:homoaconitase/3-isopropylmalate dehydratase large subunit
VGMTIAEKILSAKSGKASVTPGEIVEAYPDLVMSHTATWRSASVMKRVGATKLYDPERLAIVLDHISPAKTEKYAADQQISRNFAREYGVKKFYDVDAGIAHLVLMEAGHVAPGDLIVGTDSHCTIYGSLGALGTGIGYTEVTSVWITGKLWMKVPESIRITLQGGFGAGVYSKDLMLHLIGKLGADGCTYNSVEFYGDTVAELSVSERMTIAGTTKSMRIRMPNMNAGSRWTWRNWNRWWPARMRCRTRSRLARWSGLISTRPSWGLAPMPNMKTWWWRRGF